MYKLYGNDNFLEDFGTIEQAEQGLQEYKEIEKALYNENTINYKIVKGW